MSFPLKITLAVAGVILAGIALVAFLSNPEGTKIEEMMRQGVVWVRAGNAEGCISLLTAESTPMREEMIRLLRQHVRPSRHKDLEIRSVDVKVQDAEAKAVVFLRSGEEDALYPNVDLRLEILLRREGDFWKVTGFRLPAAAADYLR